jgi:replicative DNA helicase
MVDVRRQAELAVIGACLLEERIPDAIRGLLVPGMFSSKVTSHTWEAILEADRASEPINVLSITSRLPHNHELANFVIGCIDSVTSSGGVLYHARAVARAHIAGTAAAFAAETAALLRGGAPIETVLLESSQRLLELHHNISLLTSDGSNAFEEAQKQLHEPASLIKFGFNSIDERLGGGLVRGELTILAGRPGEGKTTLAINRLLHWAGQGYKITTLSKEMPKQVLVYYLLSQLTQIPRQAILQNNLTLDQKALLEETLKRVMEEWSTRVVIIDDCWGMEETESIIRLQRPDIVIDDFIQLSAFKNRREVRHEIQEWLKMYKRLAKEYNMCPVIVSQLNRDLEKRTNNETPMLSDLAESGALEQLAANIIFVQYPFQRLSGDSGLKNTLNLVVGKARYGMRGQIKFRFIPELGAILP